MVCRVSYIEFERFHRGFEIPFGCNGVSVMVDIERGWKDRTHYESAKVYFISPFSDRNVCLELGLSNHGRSKVVERIRKTVNSYLDAKESEITARRYCSVENHLAGKWRDGAANYGHPLKIRRRR